MAVPPHPLISVLLPARNEAERIGAALADVRQQTLADLEIIVIDDGSTDDTAAAVRAIAKEDRRIHMQRQAPRGIAAALNNGLARARGEFIARMDADDGCAPERLAKQLDLSRRESLALSSCQVAPPPGEHYAGGYDVYANWVNGLLTPGDIARERFVECPVVHPTMLMPALLLRKMNGWREGHFPEDYDLILRLLAAGYRAAKVPEPLYFWRDHPRRASRVDPRYSPEAFARLKAKYLAAGPLRHHKRIVVWGAGQTSRRTVRPLVELGHEVAAWVDIDARKIGRRRRGAPVVSPDVLPQWRDLPLLVYVGSRGARELIRPRLVQYGYVEGVNAWFCA
jgi:glycosyltransferase involved in cell wall biosynthesis